MNFLALHWENYSGEPLEDFTAEVYALMESHAELLPPRLAQILPFMQADDWLSGYRSREIIAMALDRMAEKRLTRPNALGGSAGELEARYREFERDFLAFFPDAQAFSAAFHHGGYSGK